MSCPSCCSACSALTEVPVPPSIDDGPYGLSNFLPAGTFQLDILPEPPGVVQQLCDHTSHSEDGWHSFRVHFLVPWLLDKDNIGFCLGIDFLIENHFMSATYRFCPPTTIIVRVYIIPYDLGNVKGKLRIRKETVLAPARRYLKGLLQRITRDNESWQGNGLSNRRFCSLSAADNDNRTLAEIYSDLPSPQITTGSIPSTRGNVVGRLLDFRDDLGGLGMRSTLYKYQRRSVASMLQKELDPHDVPDPLFIPLVGINGEEFYFQPGTMEILRERPMVAPNRGGILCEELGTGKTVMTLALLLATVRQLPAPEGSILGTPPVMTPLAFRYFPSSHYEAVRGRFLLRGRKGTTPPPHPRVPSLVELLLHRSRANPDTTTPDTTSTAGVVNYKHKSSLAERLELSHFPQLLAANVPFYHQYHREPTNNERTKRDQSNRGPRVMYLTAATLILVPPNLIGQWDREIHKHCDYPLKVILLRSRDPLPEVKSLASDYDIILMARDRFTAEDQHKDVSKLYSWETCSCLPFPGSRIPNCQCKPSGVSPLLQIRWKRLVIDEGHISATQSTILTPFTKLLSVERIWIITGTPTTNLLGLSLGKKLNDEGQVEDDLEDNDDYDLESDREGDFDGDSNDLPTEDNSQSNSPAPSNENSTPRIWTKYDRQDLQKLGNMITHFIGVPQFIAAPKLFKTCVTDPLLDTSGPRPGAILVLNQVMNMVMIRHQISDVEEDVVLPPIKQEAILLDLDPYAAKSYNALQATIAINAVDSQRTDQDYMFHPKNSESLQLTVENMSQIMFWSVDERMHNVDQLLKDSDVHTNDAIERGASQADMALLRDAIVHVRSAAEDSLWRAMQKDVFVPYRVYRMNLRVFEAWTRINCSESTLDPLLVGFMHPDRSVQLRDLVIGRPLSSEDTIVEWGLALTEKDRKQSQLFEESEKRKSKRKLNRKSARQDDGSYGSLKAARAANKATPPAKLKEMRTELRKALAKLDSLENGEAGPATKAARITSVSAGQPSELLTCSLLANVRVGSSASSKLNYIINEVIQHTHDEKFLIFSQSALSLAHVADALELIQVRCLRLSTQDSPRVREQQVMTFETSEAFRVFLMELRHGARGLNLISASRVIFCEPVWQADVESQAIKRAHRIGQTRAITVKTLAIRGTAEENMVARRNAIQGSYSKLPKLIEEAGMRHYIANPKFINYPPTLLPTLDVPLIKLSHDEPVQPSTVAVTVSDVPMIPSQARVRHVDPTDEFNERPKKKAKGVTFAD